MSQKVLVRGFKWVEYTSQFSKDFIENFKRDSDDGYFLEVDIQHPKRSLTFSQWVSLFFWNNESWKSWEKRRSIKAWLKRYIDMNIELRKSKK